MEKQTKTVVLGRSAEVPAAPKSGSGAAEVSPGSFVASRDKELIKERIHRRVFLSWVGRTLFGTLSAIGAADGTIHVAERLGFYDPDADQKLLGRLFFDESVPSGALIPASDHPFKKPPIDGYYPTELANCLSYRRRFFQHASLETVNKIQEIRADDTAVLFGSQVSNLATRWLMGNPFDLTKPTLEIGKKDLGWKASLRWNLYTPPDAISIERQQFGEPWFTRNHLIGDCDGNSYGSRLLEQGIEDDYFLITALPRFSTGRQRFIIFAGCHGPAQRVATELMNGDWREELKKVDKALLGAPHYQALFHVDVSQDDAGEFIPKGIQLVEAAPIKLHFSRSR